MIGSPPVLSGLPQPYWHTSRRMRQPAYGRTRFNGVLDGLTTVEEIAETLGDRVVCRDGWWWSTASYRRLLGYDR